MKQLNIMVKPASSACNLRCRYCFYADVAQNRACPSFGRMRQGDAERMLTAVARDCAAGDQIGLAFQGGEPTLAGLDFYRAFTDAAARLMPRARLRYSIQTNGTLLDGAWADFLSEKQFLVGLSLDLLPQLHDRYRSDASGGGSYAQVTRAMRLLRTRGVEYNVLCTLTEPLSRHPAAVWRQIQRLNIDYVQFIPCLDALNAAESHDYALTPQGFASFYNGLFPLWLRDWEGGRYRSVKLFDDTIHLFACGIPCACGINGICQPQLVVEADGSVYPCDFYCLDTFRLGNITESGPIELLKAEADSAFRRANDRPEMCGACPYLSLCGGGCKRMRHQLCRPPSCGYRGFLDRCGEALMRAARRERAALSPPPIG